MTISATEFETDLVDLSSFGLQEVMALRDPLVAESLRTLVTRLCQRTASQQDGGGSGSPYLPSACGSGPA